MPEFDKGLELKCEKELELLYEKEKPTAEEDSPLLNVSGNSEQMLRISHSFSALVLQMGNEIGDFVPYLDVGLWIEIYSVLSPSALSGPPQ